MKEVGAHGKQTREKVNCRITVDLSPYFEMELGRKDAQSTDKLKSEAFMVNG